MKERNFSSKQIAFIYAPCCSRAIAETYSACTSWRRSSRRSRRRQDCKGWSTPLAWACGFTRRVANKKLRGCIHACMRSRTCMHACMHTGKLASNTANFHEWSHRQATGQLPQTSDEHMAIPVNYRFAGYKGTHCKTS